MLTFSLTICVAVSIVDIDGASDSIAIPKKARRRLIIFESITKSDEIPLSMRRKESGTASDDDQSVNDILQDSLVELTNTLRTLETNDPSKAMRVPVRVIPMQSAESLLVFQSLLKMVSNPTQSHPLTSWQQYLVDAIRKQQCSEVDLCREFHQNFKCDEEGHLRVITLDIKGPFDHLDLLMIPNTVTSLSVRRTKLRTISEWTDLKEKSLKTLRLDANYELKLNLDALNGELQNLPLKHLTVSKKSIANYFGEGDGISAFSKIGNWMRASTLTSLTLRKRTRGYPRCEGIFDSDGSWTLQVPSKDRIGIIKSLPVS